MNSPHNFYYPTKFEAEGEDHINISPFSEFYLGRVFEPSYLKIFTYPYIGKFRSVYNLWGWLKTKTIDDRLRRKGLRQIQALLKETKSRESYVPNFKCIIAHATYIKILNDPVAVNEIRKLPDDVIFLSYYTPKGSPVRICSNYAGIIIPAAYEIVRAVKTGEEPNFLSMSERGMPQGLCYLEPFLKIRLEHKSNVERYISNPHKDIHVERKR